MLIEHGHIEAVLLVIIEQLAQIQIGNVGAVGQQHVLLIGAGQELGDILQRAEAAQVVILRRFRGEGGQQVEAGGLAGQIPRLAAADMVHQGLIVVVGDDANLADAGADHVGQREVDQAVTAAEGDGRHGADAGQLRDAAVVRVGKDDA